MNIVVCAKQVPDTAAKIQDRVDDGRLSLEDVNWVVSPYDEYATEEALRINERSDDETNKVTIMTLGPGRALQATKDMMALGADEGVHLSDEAFEDSDPYATAYILSKALEKIEYDMIWTGWKGVDEDHGQVGIILAEMLGIPHVSFVVDIEIAEDGKSAVIHSQIEGGDRIIETPLPAVLTAQKGLNEPRYASLKGIMAVKKKTIHEWNAEDLGIDPRDVGSSAVKMNIVNVERPPKREGGRILNDSPEEAARKLAHLLRDEAKVV